MCVCICVCVPLSELMCTTFMQVSHGGQWALDPLEWELSAVVSCHMGARNRAQVHCKSNRHF